MADAVDENGHVNNVVYVQWMQDVAVAHAATVGCTARTQAIGATWVARSHHVDYLRPAFAGETIEVATWIADFGRARSQRRYRFTRLADGVVLVRGATDWVFVDSASGRPRAIPPEVLATFDCFGEQGEPE
jgi:acyl-CoA thioester hydrolase